jgi:alkylhydroperoxidase family enzyme
MSDPAGRYRAHIDAVREAVLEGPGVVPRERREAAARNAEVPAPFASYVDAIHRHAYRITDRAVDDLRAAGASEEEIFEMTIAAAYGAAFEHFGAGLRALRSAGGDGASEEPA